MNRLMEKEGHLDLESERVVEWGFSVDFKNYDYPLDEKEMRQRYKFFP